MQQFTETSVLLGGPDRMEKKRTFIQRNAHPIVAALGVACVGMVAALASKGGVSTDVAAAPAVSMAGAHAEILAANPDLYVGSHSFPNDGSSPTFTRYTWNVTKVRSVHPAGQRKPKGRPEQNYFMEVTEMYFYDKDGKQVVPAVAAPGPGSVYVQAKSPSNLIDGNDQTAYINEGHFKQHYTLTDFYFQPAVAIETVYFVTGKSWRSRDPISWTWTGSNSVSSDLGTVEDHDYNQERYELVQMPVLELPDHPPIVQPAAPPCVKPVETNNYKIKVFGAKDSPTAEVGDIEFVDKTYFKFNLQPTEGSFPLRGGLNATINLHSPNNVRVWYYRVKTSTSSESMDPTSWELIRQPKTPDAYAGDAAEAVETTISTVVNYQLPSDRGEWSDWIEVCGV